MTTSSQPSRRTWMDATTRFAEGGDSPSAYLERCISAIAQNDVDVRAFVTTNLTSARAAAVASTERWRQGRALSPIDGMPIGIKDIIETADMPTEQGSPLFLGWRGNRDAASVVALREAGAVVVGKTVTTEFAAASPGPTRNPWDLSRTPGGSSSGSAAAVGCGMLPAALGTQVIGSIIRPASFCGAFGYKASLGGLNRGGSFDGLSQSAHGVIGASLAEAWVTARAISLRVGGDPGAVGLTGPETLPTSKMPKRMAFIRTAGWDAASHQAQVLLLEAIDRLRAGGVEVCDAGSDTVVADLERAIISAGRISRGINAWESRWLLRTYAADMDSRLLSEAMQQRLEVGAAMTQQDAIELLQEREAARDAYARLECRFDACLTLSATGPAPVGLAATGDATFTLWTSMLGVPTLSLPVFSVDGLPLGLQLVGGAGRDADLFASGGAILGLLE